MQDPTTETLVITAVDELIVPDDAVTLTRESTELAGVAGATPAPLREIARLVRTGRATILNLSSVGDALPGEIRTAIHPDVETAEVAMTNAAEELRRDGWTVVA